MTIKATLAGLYHDERGATAVEYGLLLAIMVLMVLGSLSGFGTAVTNMWNGTNAKVSSATSAAAAG